MNRLCLAITFVAFLATSCIDEVDNSEFRDKYAQEFSNRTTVTVYITSEVVGEYYSIFYENPYDEGSLVRQPVLAGCTPIATTLDVPNDVETFYVVAQGDMKSYPVGNLTITPANSSLSRASDTRHVSAEVMTQVNSIYFPEKTNNVQGNNLFKCTDLVIAETPATSEFEKAEVWLTFLGDGGCRMSKLYGYLWFYTYPSAKRDQLTPEDCTFYGVKEDEVVEIPYTDIRNNTQKPIHWLFYTKDELKTNVASYKRFKLGEFAKGLNVGFVYLGNSKEGNDGLRFTTPHLNPQVKAGYTFTYRDDSGSFVMPADGYLANGFICHVTVGDFQGNVLGMENRIVSEAKYDGDYNDILCLVESNPKQIKPAESVDIGNSDKEPDKIACKTTSGLYLFEDNYPSQGDFDFNDAVICYEIKDYYESKNKAKQVTVRSYAIGAGMSNTFGFFNAGKFVPLLPDLEGFRNVYANQSFEPIGEEVVQTLYGEVLPCLKSGSNYYIYSFNFNTVAYPCVLDIPLSLDDDASWKFEWAQEQVNIDDCYYFLKQESGEPRAKDWYLRPKNPELLFHRN